jgi:uncharacterized protein YdhG (YjbR/CyaY superfamily)
VQSKASTVAEYLKEVPEPRRTVMTELCSLCRKHLAGYEEGMEYGMPYYKKGGQAVGIASQKSYISIYGLRKQVAEAGVMLAGAKAGKGCLTFAKPETIDLKQIETLLLAKCKAG